MASHYIKWILYISGDILIALTIWVVSIVIRQVAKPYERGFFCDDESLMHPFKNSTVSVTVMYTVGFVLPCFCIVLCECLIMFTNSKQHSKKQRPITEVLFKDVFKTLVAFFFGAGVTNLTTNIPKYVIGRLRPHFFAVCKPDWTIANCSMEGIPKYITNDVCTGTDKDLITEARVSFLSGHTSMSMYFMVFLLIYIQRRFTWKGLQLLKPTLQTVFFCLALYTGLTRISDYKHHWSDVLVATFLGAAVAILTVFKVSGLYAEPVRCTCQVESKVELKKGTAREDCDKLSESRLRDSKLTQDELDETTAM